jgi:hypothetical protein
MEKLQETTDDTHAYNQERNAVLSGVRDGVVVELHNRRGEQQAFDTLLHVVIGEVVEKPPQVFDQDA